MQPTFSGKIRDIYDLTNNRKAIVVSNRVSAFDFVLGEVPGKGAVLNQIAAWWFKKLSENQIPHHLISVPHPNVSEVKSAKVFPIEFVVRGYLTGSTRTSSWYAYQHLNRQMCGLEMPIDMVKNQAFPAPIITPTTKGIDGHDESISKQEILDQGIIDPKTYEHIELLVLKTFSIGQRIAAELGLILVDTKYELGIDENGHVMLVDEVHTPDSSRYWIAKTYNEKMAASEEPDSLDKEFVRRLVVSAGYDINSDQNPKDFMTPKIINQAAEKYQDLRHRFIADKDFMVSEKTVEDTLKSL